MMHKSVLRALTRKFSYMLPMPVAIAVFVVLVLVSLFAPGRAHAACQVNGSTAICDTQGEAYSFADAGPDMHQGWEWCEGYNIEVRAYGENQYAKFVTIGPPGGECSGLGYAWEGITASASYTKMCADRENLYGYRTGIDLITGADHSLMCHDGCEFAGTMELDICDAPDGQCPGGGNVKRYHAPTGEVCTGMTGAPIWEEAEPFEPTEPDPDPEYDDPATPPGGDADEPGSEATNEHLGPKLDDIAKATREVRDAVNKKGSDTVEAINNAAGQNQRALDRTGKNIAGAISEAIDGLGKLLGGGGGGGGGGGNGDGECDAECVGGDGGNDPGGGWSFYEGHGKTIGDVVDEYMARIAQSELVSAPGNFFNISGVGGTCPTFSYSGGWVIPALSLDFHCSGPIANAFNYAGWLILAIAAFAAFRIGFY